MARRTATGNRISNLNAALILPLSDPQAVLESIGLKGLSLVKMFNEGDPVPDGFNITTKVYRQFVA